MDIDSDSTQSLCLCRFFLEMVAHKGDVCTCFQETLDPPFILYIQDPGGTLTQYWGKKTLATPIINSLQHHFSSLYLQNDTNLLHTVDSTTGRRHVLNNKLSTSSSPPS